MRIHIFGAAGTGTTTLGQALGEALGILHLDADDFYWKQTDPPFSEKQPPEMRVANILAAVEGHDRYVLSGSMCGWGDELIPRFSHMIFLTATWETRRQRLLTREVTRYGAEVLAPGGRMHEIHRKFLAWSSRYDTAGLEQRSRAKHEAWMAALPAGITIIRLDGGQPPETVFATALSQLTV